MHSQRIGKAAPNAIQGNLEAFKQLDDSRKEFNRDLNVLLKGGDYQGREIAAPNGHMETLLNDTQKIWTNSDKAADTILKLKKELTGFGTTLQKLNALSPVLLELTEQIATLKAQGGASPREISAAGQLVMLTQRLGRSANEFLTSEGVNPETAFLLGKDTNTFRDITEGFLNGSDVLRLTATKDQDTREKLTELQGVPAVGGDDSGQSAKLHCRQTGRATDLCRERNAEAALDRVATVISRRRGFIKLVVLADVGQRAGCAACLCGHRDGAVAGQP
jgi:twitching motility protein PilJ